MTRTELLLHPPHRPLVGASILAADFAHLADDARRALNAGADFLHVDVMDGHFVPNLTMGPELVRRLRAALPDAVMDVHLMVTDPGLFIRPFADAGADHVTFHVEAVAEPAGLAQQVRDAGMSVGLALNPPTDVQQVMPHVDAFDLILVMSVNPGFAGQSFIGSVLDKARALVPRLRPTQRLEIDGGVNGGTAGACREAGCDALVAASAIFGSDSYDDAVAALRGRVGAGSVDADRA